MAFVASVWRPRLPRINRAPPRERVGLARAHAPNAIAKNAAFASHLVVLVRSVREVEARDVHAGAQELLNHLDAARAGAERAHDLEKSKKLERVSECCWALSFAREQQTPSTSQRCPRRMRRGRPSASNSPSSCISTRACPPARRRGPAAPSRFLFGNRGGLHCSSVVSLRLANECQLRVRGA